MPKRKNNWPAALALFAQEKRDQPFDWARNNCAFFACDWLAILVGVDPASDFRDRVDSALSAARAIEAAGGLERIIEDACARWSWPESPVALARRGDVVVFDMPDGPTLGVCDGRDSLFPGEGGIVRQKTSSCRRAWRIG